MSTLAVDPGIRGCGTAVFDPNGRLVECAYVPNTYLLGNRACEVTAMAREVWGRYAHRHKINDVAVEWPQIYRHSKGDPNDLLALGAIGAAIAMAFDEAGASYLPAEWKGQLTKAACHARIKKRLDAQELALLAEVRPVRLAHNVWDAVGIGLHHFGRMRRQRVVRTGQEHGLVVRGG